MRGGMARMLSLLLLFGILLSVSAETDPQDVAALQALYGALNTPPELVGWNLEGGDPCGKGSWTGVSCSGPSVTSIRIDGLGIGGYLGLELSSFQSLKELDASNNKIGGEIPSSLPQNATLINLACNRFTMNIPYSLPSLKFIGHLNLSHNFLSGPVGNVFTGLNHLKEMDLSFNNFSGDLPSSFSLLTHLHGLYLQENQFTGSVAFLSNLPLTILNLENNHFSGVVPKQFQSIARRKIGGNMFQQFDPKEFASNDIQTPENVPADQYVNGSIPKPSTSGNSFVQEIKHNKKSMGKRAMAGTVSGVLMAALLGSIVSMHACKSHRSKFKRSKNTDDTSFVLPITTSEEDQNHWSEGAPPVTAHVLPSVRRIKQMAIRKSCSRRSKELLPAKLYSGLDLLTATQNFSEENLLGNGYLGHVYKAQFPDGQILAVKKIVMNELAIYEDDEFLDVVCNLSRLKHPNIMSLQGYCVEQGEHILVYDYARNGSLDDVLGREVPHSFPWEARVKIALGVARALEYLHWTCSPPVAHGNLKATNILFDKEFVPHLSDCGLTVLKPLVNTERKAPESPCGYKGYMAPEFGCPGADRTRSDIFSFGVVLLELLTGKKAFDSSRMEEQQYLVHWASPSLHDICLLEEFLDPAIRGTFSFKALSQFADIVLVCIQPQPEFRPLISEIAEMLVGLIEGKSHSVKPESHPNLGPSPLP